MTAPEPPAPPPWFRGLWVPVLAGVIVIGVLLGIVVLRDRPSEPSAAVERPLLLRAAAALEARTPEPVRVPRPDEWLFIRTASDWVEGRNEDNDGWTRADYKLGAQLDGGRVRTYDDEGVPWTVARVFPDLVEAYEFYAGLPDDPAAVRRALFGLVDEHRLYKSMSICHEAGDCPGGNPEPWSRYGPAFLLVNAMLKETVPPPAAAAKLYRALADVPGVEDGGSTIDLTGKKTVVVRWQPPAAAQLKGEAPRAFHILLDAETYEYRGDLFTGDTMGMRDDGVTASDIILSAGFVDKVGQYPPLTDRPEFPTVLHDAADRLTSTDPIEAPGRDQWRYRKVVRAWLDWPNEEREHWLGVDQPLRNGIEANSFADLSDVYAFYRDLPDDPAAALDAIYAKAGDGDRALAFTCHSPRACGQMRKEGWARHAAAYELIHRLLYISAPPPRIQATLFRAIAAIPGVESRGTAKDATGGPVLVVGWQPPVEIRNGLDLSRRIQLLIDPETSRYRGYRELDEADWGTYEPVDSYAVLAAAFVDEDGARP